MTKTINKKLSEERKNRELIKKIAKRLKISDYLPNLSNKEVYRRFCLRYGKAIAPGLEKIDQWQARSFGRMFTKVVRGGYSHN